MRRRLSLSAPLFGARVNEGFSLVELLTVVVIISIVAAASASVIPSVFQSNQMDANVSNISGIFEQAREAAISGNTYVYVLFSNSLPTTPAGGVGAIILESEDGTDALSNFTVTGSINTVSDLFILHKLQPLPGIKLTTSGTISTTLIPTLPSVSPAGASLAGNPTALNLKLAVGSTTYTFTQGVAFQPDGEVLNPVAAWNDLVEFGVEPTQGTVKDVAVMRLTRLTGKLSVYRQ